jgi:hypothetical protein
MYLEEYLSSYSGQYVVCYVVYLIVMLDTQGDNNRQTERVGIAIILKIGIRKVIG